MAKKSSQKKISAEDILADHSPEIRTLAENLRRIIRETVPSAAEKAYPTWHGVGYHHPECGYFCAIFPQENNVRLGFEFGVLLPDPDGLLQGDGSQVRYVILEPDRKIPLKGIQILLHHAINLPASRETKLALIRSSAKPVLGKDRDQ